MAVQGYCLERNQLSGSHQQHVMRLFGMVKLDWLVTKGGQYLTAFPAFDFAMDANQHGWSYSPQKIGSAAQNFDLGAFDVNLDQ